MIRKCLAPLCFLFLLAGCGGNDNSKNGGEVIPDKPGYGELSVEETEEAGNIMLEAMSLIGASGLGDQIGGSSQLMLAAPGDDISEVIEKYCQFIETSQEKGNTVTFSSRSRARSGLHPCPVNFGTNGRFSVDQGRNSTSAAGNMNMSMKVTGPKLDDLMQIEEMANQSEIRMSGGGDQRGNINLSMEMGGRGHIIVDELARAKAKARFTTIHGFRMNMNGQSDPNTGEMTGMNMSFEFWAGMETSSGWAVLEVVATITLDTQVIKITLNGQEINVENMSGTIAPSLFLNMAPTSFIK